MKKSRFTEAQIVAILKEGEAGVPVAELTRNMGTAEAPINWRSKYGGVSVNELKRMKELEAENAKPSECTPTWLWRMRRSRRCCPENRNAVRQAPGPAEWFVREHRLPIQRACRIVGLSRTAFCRVPRSSVERDSEVIAALGEMVAKRPRWGFWKYYDRRVGTWRLVRLGRLSRGAQYAPRTTLDPQVCRGFPYSLRPALNA